MHFISNFYRNNNAEHLERKECIPGHMTSLPQ